METKKTVVLLGLLVIASSWFAFAYAVQNTEGKKLAISTYERIARKMGKPTVQTPKFYEKEDFCKRRILRINDNSLEITVDGETSKLIGYYDWELSELAFPEKPAAMRKEEVVSVGKNTVESLLGYFPSDYVLTQTKYSQGNWRLTWHRALNGYQYRNDSFWVYIIDSNKKLTCFKRTPRYKNCATKIEITGEEAKQRALEVAKQWFPRLFPAKAKIKKYSLGGIVKTRLLIVTPNGFYSEPRDYRLSSRESRLAYEVTVGIKVNDKLDPCYGMYIWVDSENGKLLGGSSSL